MLAATVNTIEFGKLGIGPFEINRVAFSIFGMDIYWYAIIITAGILAATLAVMETVGPPAEIPAAAAEALATAAVIPVAAAAVVIPVVVMPETAATLAVVKIPAQRNLLPLLRKNQQTKNKNT